MTKNFKLALALIVAVMLLVSSMAALADDPATHTITITAPADHTYEVYQVLRGNVDDTNPNQLNNLLYGTNSAKGTAGEKVSIEHVQALEALSKATYADDQAKIAAYEEYVTFANPVATVGTGTATAALEEGWYVIKDKDNTAPDGEGVTLYMFQVLNDNLSISAKSDKTSSEKKVQDINDSTDADYTTLTDTADYDVGDTIPYTLTFTLPSDYANFKKYYVNFKDTLSAGLTYNGDAKIYYGASDTTGETIDFGSGLNLSYEIMDLKTGTEKQKALAAGDVITIKYTCYLNETSVVYGNPGNPNTYKVEFSRNPNEGGTGKPTETTETPVDTNVVFTYKTVFDKVDENKQPLEGADFKLEKKLQDGSWVEVTELGDSAHPQKVGSSADKSTSFEFKGLDDGHYRLTEIYTPAGYNTIDPIEFDIVADHSVDPATLEVTNLQATSLEMTVDTAKGTLKTSVVNESGVVLPSTGGIGTTIFYVAGSLMVLAAAILLVTKRRMGSND